MIDLLHAAVPLALAMTHAAQHTAAWVATNPISQFLHPIFGPLVDLLRSVLRAIHSVFARIGLPGAWGWSIVVLTIIVRLILMPFTYKQFRSQRATMALQGKIKELQRKYKGNRAKIQEETMKLYQEYNISPFASCWPMLLQLPVFICLYYAIRGTVELQLGGWLWIPAGKVLSTSPYVYVHGLGHPDPYYILLILYVATQIISTELMLTPETDRQQKMIMRLMPLFFVFILFRFPSGLFIYWVTTNIWTIGQQLVIRKTTPPPEELLKQMAAKPAKSGLMQRMAEAQKSAQERAAAKEGGSGDGADGASSSAGKPKQKPKTRPGGTRPQRKSGGASQGKRPSKQSGASSGRKRPSS